MIGSITGLIGKDAQTTQSGFMYFSLAKEVYRKDGNITVWYTVFGNSEKFKNVIQYLKKGKAIQVFGEHFPEPYTTREGKHAVAEKIEAYKISFVPQGKKKKETDRGSYSSSQSRTNQQTNQQEDFGDIPF